MEGTTTQHISRNTIKLYAAGTIHNINFQLINIYIYYVLHLLLYIIQTQSFYNCCPHFSHLVAGYHVLPSVSSRCWLCSSRILRPVHSPQCRSCREDKMHWSLAICQRIPCAWSENMGAPLARRYLCILPNKCSRPVQNPSSSDTISMYRKKKTLAGKKPDW